MSYAKTILDPKGRDKNVRPPAPEMDVKTASDYPLTGC